MWRSSKTRRILELCKAVSSMDVDRPSSMWQWPAFWKLLRDERFSTIAFHQLDFGTAYPKSTRMVLLNIPQHSLPVTMRPGPPVFNEQGFYAGPLERPTCSQTLTRTTSAFATTGTEQWPPTLCKWVARLIVDRWHAHTRSASSEGVRENTTGVEMERVVNYPANLPESDKLVGEDGPPREVHVPGKDRPYRDGAGLVSMGRWDPEKRNWRMENFWETLRSRSLPTPRIRSIK